MQSAESGGAGVMTGEPLYAPPLIIDTPTEMPETPPYWKVAYCGAATDNE